ncbi:MAG: iron ABC transporter permease [Kangiellaceae bacterium]|nr:iron ABC transporter permease [Kangiellaceae bacterium]
MINRFSITAFLSLMFLVLSFTFATGIGSVSLSASDVINSIFICGGGADSCAVDELYQKIIWEIRLPRIIMAFLTGVGLSITGAILQSVTRNPLADPYLFGISSGAALGAVIVIASISGAAISITFGALLGGVFSVILMLVLAGRASVQVERLLLSGVAVSFMLSSFTSLIIYYSEPDTAGRLLFWLMGSFSNSQWEQLALPAVTTSLGLALFVIYRKWITAIQAGDEGAFTLGVPVNKLRLGMLVIGSMITAVLVAQVGGIGFVGLMIPHICRYLVGSQLHRVLLMCVLIGGSFMIWVDVIARTILTEQVIPVGIVTSAIGSFFFFIVLKTKREI